MAKVIDKQINFSVAAHEGNPFTLMSHFEKKARDEGWTKEEIKVVIEECKRGPMEHLVETLQAHCLEEGYPEEEGENRLAFSSAELDNVEREPPTNKKPENKENKVAATTEKKMSKSALAKKYLGLHPELWTKPGELAALITSEEGVEVKASDVSAAKTNMAKEGGSAANTSSPVTAAAKKPGRPAAPQQTLPTPPKAPPTQASPSNGPETIADLILTLKQMKDKLGGAGEVEKLMDMSTRLGGSEEVLKVLRALD